jgi:uncharacterized protein YqiB (DUF1249 family)
MTNTVETLKAQFTELVMNREVTDLATVKALYEEALALVPERLLPWVNPRFTGTVETVMAKTNKNFDTMYACEYNAYVTVGYRITHLITDTLGLRD